MKRIYINPSFEVNGLYTEDVIDVSNNPPRTPDENTTPDAGFGGF